MADPSPRAELRKRRQRRRRVASFAVVALLLGAAAGVFLVTRGDDSGTAAPATTTTLPKVANGVSASYTATPLRSATTKGGDVPVYAAPDANSAPAATLSAQTEYTLPRSFLAFDQYQDWLHVYLPTRPNPDVEVSEVDEARLDKVRQLMANRPPYQALQATTPQTIGYALTDSPVGQLAWIAERFAHWTDPRSLISDERMLTDISLYWLTATAASSARLSRETPRRIEPCPVPVGVAVFAHDITQSVRPLAERLYDIRHWSEFERGGHFAAMEVPELFAEDVRDFFLTHIKTHIT